MLTDVMLEKCKTAIDKHIEGLRRLNKMWLDPKVLFYDDNIEDYLERMKNEGAVVLAGPTSRDAIPDYLWRKDAHHYLRASGFEGFIIVPEFRGQSYLQNTFKDDFTSSEFVRHWERTGLRHSQYRMFWIPRNREQLLGLTTNRELGQWIAFAENDLEVSKRLFIGWPDGTPNMGSLEFEIHTSKVGDCRNDGEVNIKFCHYSGLKLMCDMVSDSYSEDFKL